MKKFNTLWKNVGLCLIICCVSLTAQESSFTKTPLIITSGYNTDAAIGATLDYSYGSYLAWVNINAGHYSVYLMNIGGEVYEPALIYQSDSLITNLAVNWEGNLYFDRIDGEYWSLNRIDDTGLPVVFQDSLTSPSQPSIHGDWLTWIQNDNLLFVDTNQPEMIPIIADTSQCRQPSIFHQGNSSNWETFIIYEAGSTLNPEIKYISFEDDDELPQVHVLSSQYPSRNPTLGSYYGSAFEVFIEDNWHIVHLYDPLHAGGSDTTSNQSFNLTDPTLYMGYWLVGREVDQDFIVAVSDSLENNLEIYFTPLWNGESFNLSNMPGNDISPLVANTYGDSITVIWEHETDSGSELWWAKDRLDAGAVSPEPVLPKSISITNVYPTPFNPITTLEYTVLESAPIQFTIYDVTGSQVYSETIPTIGPGIHAISWEGTNNSGIRANSGLYIMEVKNGGQFDRVKVVLLK